MKKKILLLVLVSMLFIISILQATKNYEFRAVPFGEGTTRNYELKNGDSLKQVFFNVPLNCTGLEIPIKFEKKEGRVYVSLYNSDNEGSYNELVDIQIFDSHSIENDILKYVLRDGFFSTHAYYLIEITYVDEENGTVVIPLQNNQLGYYANRWDVTNQGEMIAASFLIKNYGIILNVIIILFSLFIVFNIIKLPGHSEVKTANFPKSMNGMWLCMLSLILFLLLMGDIVCKETFYGEYQYFENDNLTIEHVNNEIEICQKFVPVTDKLIRMFISKTVLDCFDEYEIVISNNKHNAIILDKNDSALSKDKYVFDIYNNQFSHQEEYKMLIRGEKHDNNLNVNYSDIIYQYKPDLDAIRILVVVCGFILIYIFLIKVKSLEKITVSKKNGMLVLIIINLVFYLCLLFVVYNRYRVGETWKIMLSYNDLMFTMMESFLISIICKIVAIKKE